PLMVFPYLYNFHNDLTYSIAIDVSSLLEPSLRFMNSYGISLTLTPRAFTSISKSILYPMASNLILLIILRLNAKNPDMGSLIFIPSPCLAILVAPLLIIFLLNGQPFTAPPLTYLDATTISHSDF